MTIGHNLSRLPPLPLPPSPSPSLSLSLSLSAEETAFYFVGHYVILHFTFNLLQISSWFDPAASFRSGLKAGEIGGE